MLLFIDTTDFQTMRFALVNNTVSESIFEIAHNENWKTLNFLEKFLKANKIRIAEIKKIVVCTGPGSFTGTRIGATIAQGLAFANNIPIVAIPKNKIPKNLLKLKTLKGTKLVNIEYHSEKNH